MMLRWSSLVIALVLTAPIARAGCAETEFERVTYAVCTYDAASDDIRLFHRDAEGNILGGFNRLEADLAASGKQLDFASNGGMYHDDRSAVGLFVENGVETAPLITSDGPGNFGLLPNGVFCLEQGRARVVESHAFEKEKPTCRFASQSGPMLVIDGALHPRFLKDSDSIHIRNGVGVSADGRTVTFAISNARVNFYTFGRLFRDHLGMQNALYFDGKVSRLFSRELGRSDAGFPMGPMVGVVSPAK